MKTNEFLTADEIVKGLERILETTKLTDSNKNVISEAANYIRLVLSE